MYVRNVTTVFIDLKLRVNEVRMSVCWEEIVNMRVGVSVCMVYFVTVLFPISKIYGFPFTFTEPRLADSVHNDSDDDDVVDDDFLQRVVIHMFLVCMILKC